MQTLPSCCSRGNMLSIFFKSAVITCSTRILMAWPWLSSPSFCTLLAVQGYFDSVVEHSQRSKCWMLSKRSLLSSFYRVFTLPYVCTASMCKCICFILFAGMCDMHCHCPQNNLDVSKRIYLYCDMHSVVVKIIVLCDAFNGQILFRLYMYFQGCACTVLHLMFRLSDHLLHSNIN